MMGILMERLITDLMNSGIFIILFTLIILLTGIWSRRNTYRNKGLPPVDKTTPMPKVKPPKGDKDV